MRSVLALILASSCAPKIDAGKIPVKEADLPVVVTADPAAAGLVATIEAGSARDPIGHDGIAALVARTLAPAGAAIAVDVGRDEVRVTSSCYDAACVDVFADALTKPAFAQADLDAVRAAATERLDGPPSAAEVLEDWSFEGRPYGHPVDGRTGVLPLATPADLQAFWAANYVRESVRVTVPATLDPALLVHLQDRLTALPGTLPPDNALPMVIVPKGHPLLVVGGVPTASLALGAPLDPGASADHDALAAAATALAASLGAEVTFAPDPDLRQSLWSVVLPTGDDPVATLKKALDALAAAAKDPVVGQHVDPANVRIVALATDGEAVRSALVAGGVADGPGTVVSAKGLFR